MCQILSSSNESDSKSIAIINIGSKSHFLDVTKKMYKTLDHTHTVVAQDIITQFPFLGTQKLPISIDLVKIKQSKLCRSKFQGNPHITVSPNLNLIKGIAFGPTEFYTVLLVKFRKVCSQICMLYNNTYTQTHIEVIITFLNAYRQMNAIINCLQITS